GAQGAAGSDRLAEEDYSGNDENGDQGEKEIKAEFTVEAVDVMLAGEEAKVEAEIGAGEEHENQDDHFDIEAVIVGDAGIFSRKAAGGDGAEGVAEGVKQRHAAEEQEHNLDQGEQQIDPPENFGGIGDARAEAVLDRSRHFRLEELHAADAEQGED